MTVLLYTHPACLEHDTGPGHVESADRLRAVLAALDGPDFSALARRIAPLAHESQIERVHERPYLADLAVWLQSADTVPLDGGDTIIGPGSARAMRRAAGAGCAAVGEVFHPDGASRRAFCAVRPPGHHAEPGRGMGFCLLNNVAIAAAEALAAGHATRVAIADFDVHHGNGTQAWAQGHSDVLFLSSHQVPLYPGTGMAEETGRFGNILNAPLAPGSGSAEFRAAWLWHLLPALDRFKPQLILISAGFDAHRRDPLASLNLEAGDFAWITAQLCQSANRHAGGRVVSFLEGGYDLDALAECSAAHVRELMGA
ncbi:MAG: histone deacetylase family protein [Alphaproteobacteria bacterium]|nr:MAG: histone deacetylase family protein [Alphaproteobacteria bacterium]